MTDWELPPVNIYAEGHGGFADTWDPQGNTPYTYYNFVVSGVVNQDPVSASRNPAGAVASRYYQGYWAGVQAELYGLSSENPFLSFGLTPPVSPFGAHSYGFAVDVLQALAQPPTQDLTARVAAAAGALGHVSHPFELWLISPTAQTDWYLGSGANGDWPIDLPDWGDRPSGPLPPMPGFSPIKGNVRDIFSFATSDVPTEQEIQDAGNPALWLSPRIVGPMVPSLSSPGAGPDDMTPVFPSPPTTSTLIPFDITPGNTINDVTPRGDWTE